MNDTMYVHLIILLHGKLVFCPEVVTMAPSLTVRQTLQNINVRYDLQSI
jgi:hypothetical protein